MENFVNYEPQESVELIHVFILAIIVLAYVYNPFKNI